MPSTRFWNGPCSVSCPIADDAMAMIVDTMAARHHDPVMYAVSFSHLPGRYSVNRHGSSGSTGRMQQRIRVLNSAPAREPAEYVLYWAQVNRRVSMNHALAYAADIANECRLPLLVYEGLTYDYPSASDRLHTFVMQGVAETAKALRRI